MATRTRKLDKDILGVLEGPQTWKDAAWRLANDLQDQRNVCKRQGKVIRAEMAAEYDALYSASEELKKQRDEAMRMHAATHAQYDEHMARATAIHARQHLRIQGLRKALRQMQSHLGYGVLRAKIAELEAQVKGNG